MKNLRLYRYIFMMLAFVLAGSMLMAQDKESNEMKKRQAIEEERKAAMEEEMKVRKEMLETQQQEFLEHQKQQQEKMKQMELEHWDRAIDFENQSRDWERARESERSSGRSFYRTPDGHYLLGSYGQGNQSQLTLRNSFKGGSDSSKGEFDVDESIRQFRCVISGKVKSGEISIQVRYPGGKMFKDLTINSSAEISFSQSLTIKEGEQNKYVGSWIYEVKAVKAEGNYMLQIMTD